MVSEKLTPARPTTVVATTCARWGGLLLSKRELEVPVTNLNSRPVVGGLRVFLSSRSEEGSRAVNDLRASTMDSSFSLPTRGRAQFFE